MRSKRKKDLPTKLERVRRELEEWRRGKRSQGERIPERLWRAAAIVSKEYGVNRVSSALGLDYMNLKRRAGIRKVRTRKCEQPDSEALFVEVSNPGAGIETTCVVELEKGNGAKLRVCVQNAATVDWCRLKEAFLGA